MSENLLNSVFAVHLLLKWVRERVDEDHSQMTIQSVSLSHHSTMPLAKQVNEEEKTGKSDIEAKEIRDKRRSVREVVFSDVVRLRIRGVMSCANRCPEAAAAPVFNC
ncbi:hypothetical protein Baya_6037 [Bagarius yarrelli]|uniref:Uncharacterized protein n=1 Tax=Bagarius yarrelli TaxID=175774 RepID=A0A556U0W7_BAGYA|nr:hypothetical protein Baya_6037 [Bagarius yarrelli]